MQKGKLRKCHILWMMIDPPIFADQNLNENFKFNIQPRHGKIIDPQILSTGNSL